MRSWVDFLWVDGCIYLLSDIDCDVINYINLNRNWYCFVFREWDQKDQSFLNTFISMSFLFSLRSSRYLGGGRGTRSRSPCSWCKLISLSGTKGSAGLRLRPFGTRFGRYPILLVDSLHTEYLKSLNVLQRFKRTNQPYKLNFFINIKVLCPSTVISCIHINIRQLHS